MTKIPKIFFVIPWYGKEAGGAEHYTHLFCRTLLKLGMEVEVLTTCGRDVSSNWYKNHYSPGEERIDGVLVRRFPVRSADQHRFHAVNGRLLNNLLVGPHDAEAFFQNSINSGELLKHLSATARDGVFIFIPYQYGTTVLGSRVAPQNSFLMPCLHDEPVAYLTPVKEMFRNVRGSLFLTPPEAELACRIYGLDSSAVEAFGVGVHEAFVADAGRFRQKYRIDFPYILCIGRKDPGKNVYYLLDLFAQYALERKNELRLILIGPEKISLQKSGSAERQTVSTHRIVDLDFIPEQDKRDACAGAVALVQPSNRESFSMVLMEAWLAGTPVLVNGHCAVTRWLTAQANGGLYFENYYEFREELDLFLNNEQLGRQLGTQGKEFITKNYGWSDIVQRALDYIAARMV